eukprot:SAG31_NODE_198_length_20656_cov_5.167291_10_plen_214_part_00
MRGSCAGVVRAEAVGSTHRQPAASGGLPLPSSRSAACWTCRPIPTPGCGAPAGFGSSRSARTLGTPALSSTADAKFNRSSRRHRHWHRHRPVRGQRVCRGCPREHNCVHQALERHRLQRPRRTREAVRRRRPLTCRVLRPMRGDEWLQDMDVHSGEGEGNPNSSRFIPIGSQLDPNWIPIGSQLDPNWIPIGSQSIPIDLNWIPIGSQLINPN